MVGPQGPRPQKGRGGRGGKKGGGPNSKGGQTAPGAGAVGNGAPVGSAKGSKVVTVSDILSDRLTKLSTQHWPNKTDPTKNVFDAEVVKSIYLKDIGPEASSEGGGCTQKLQLLEFSSYLESYLWPHFDAASASKEHLLSLVMVINQKYKDGVPVWEAIRGSEGADAKFQSLFVRILSAYHSSPLVAFQENAAAANPTDAPSALSDKEKLTVLLFLINCFQSLEEPMIRQVVLRLVSLQLWEALTPGRRSLELNAFPQLKRHWQHLEAKRHKQASVDERPSKKTKKAGQGEASEAVGEKEGDSLSALEGSFLPQAVREFLSVLESCSEAAPLSPLLTSFCERFMELLIDLLSQLPTRRFFKALLQDLHVDVRLSLSSVGKQSRLFSQLLDIFKFYLTFEIHDHTGLPLTDQDMAAQHFAKVHLLQRLAFKYYREQLQDLAFASSAVVADRTRLRQFLARLDDDSLRDMASRLKLLDPQTDQALLHRTDLIREILVEWHGGRASMIQEINERPLYPNEKVLWDTNLIPSGHQAMDIGLLALPKLNLQFLTFVDYLLRSYTLYRIESAYAIRDDIMDTVKYVGAKTDHVSQQVVFTGWARMGVPIRKGGLAITEVRKPNLGERIPSMVRAEIRVDLGNFQGAIREEWDSLREHDVVFLLTIENPEAITSIADNFPLQGNGRGRGAKKGQGPRKKDARLSEEDEARDFCRKYGIKYVRGAEIWEVRDQENFILNDPSGRPETRRSGAAGTRRVYKVLLDPAQYHMDVVEHGSTNQDGSCLVYETMNLLVRRRSKENNFKAVLETIRDMMNTAYVGKAVPSWLHDVFLGYGNAAQAHYRSLPLEQQQLKDVDMFDTFLDTEHLTQSFPTYKVKVEGPGADAPYPPLRLTFVNDSGPAQANKAILAKTYERPNPGPYPQDQPQRNTVRFTPVQVEAIRSGLNPGLTMVVGPPGTGKTDVAVQIISNLYHAFPSQKTLLVTHSNAALNDLFEKIMARDIDPRHLLRLGAGERELSVNATGGGFDFSKWGRVNYTLARRLELLSEVQRLAESIGVMEEVSATCETAASFRLYQVQSRMEAFEAAVSTVTDAGAVAGCFPFTAYFLTAPQPIFKKQSAAQDLELARGCFRHINRIFEELEDYRAFELLRNQTMRADYLLTKQARIVAMTCTHAALTRRKLVELGFKFDNLVMEEAAQILEVETFIPMLLQDVDAMDGARLKRVVLLGDHHQLPPIVQNMALQKFSRLDQSLFARFVRLGVQTVQLDKQGRARPSLASLYSWRYQSLGNLDMVTHHPSYQLANAGLALDHQLINVEDFHGVGESCPSPYFYQNLGEAEYVVALYQYMRLCGYPAEKISILTTYNGQKHLIRDVLTARCSHPIFGFPAAVATVDKYQGQQNDYILLSLVRTKHIGHLRDVRRLVVAMSRARLGLYVFCRQTLFENCFELTQTFNKLLTRPAQLQLVLNERYGSVTRKVEEVAGGEQLYGVENVFHMGVLVHQLLQNYQQAMSTVLDVPPPPSEDSPALVSEAVAVDGDEKDPEEGEEGQDVDDEAV